MDKQITFGHKVKDLKESYTFNSFGNVNIDIGEFEKIFDEILEAHAAELREIKEEVEDMRVEFLANSENTSYVMGFNEAWDRIKIIINKKIASSLNSDN